MPTSCHMGSAALEIPTGFLDGASKNHILIYICLYSKSLNKTSAHLILQLAYEIMVTRIIIRYYKWGNWSTNSQVT